MIDPQVAWDKFSNFETAEQLREYFQEEGIMGVVGNASQCPIAKWFQQTTRVPLVTVAAKIKFFGKNAVEAGPDIVFPMTDAAHAFINEFDHNNYPELTIPDGMWQ